MFRKSNPRLIREKDFQLLTTRQTMLLGKLKKPIDYE